MEEKLKIVHQVNVIISFNATKCSGEEQTTKAQSFTHACVKTG